MMNKAHPPDFIPWVSFFVMDGAGEADLALIGDSE
ncbi:hypothetical protein SAAL107622_06635 [Lacicoccus alkaliphilus]